MNDHQQITAERGRRAADLRAAAVALLEQQTIAAGVMLDLDSDQVVAAGPKSAILYLLSNGAPATASGDELPPPKARATEYFSDEPVYSAAEVLEIRRAAVSAATKPTACTLPPAGWSCTRTPGHEGPCAAVPTEVCADDYTPEQFSIYQHGVEDGKLIARGMERYKAGIAARESATKPTADLSIDTPEFRERLRGFAGRIDVQSDPYKRFVGYINRHFYASTPATADMSKRLRDLANSALPFAGVTLRTDELKGIANEIDRMASLLATKPAAAPAVPGGFVIVPKASTLEMDSAGHDALLARGCMAAVSDAENCWNAMIEAWAAAPAASTPAAPADWREIAAQACYGQRETKDALKMPEDVAYNQAIENCMDAIRDLPDVFATPAASTTGAAQTAEQVRTAVARAIWNLRREEEDRCDMELEDMGPGHSVWQEADAAIHAMARPTPTHSSEAGDA